MGENIIPDEALAAANEQAAPGEPDGGEAPAEAPEKGRPDADEAEGTEEAQEETFDKPEFTRQAMEHAEELRNRDEALRQRDEEIARYRIRDEMEKRSRQKEAPPALPDGMTEQSVQTLDGLMQHSPRLQKIEERMAQLQRVAGGATLMSTLADIAADPVDAKHLPHLRDRLTQIVQAGGVTDPDAIRLAYKAMAYDRIKADSVAAESHQTQARKATKQAMQSAGRSVGSGKTAGRTTAPSVQDFVAGKVTPADMDKMSDEEFNALAAGLIGDRLGNQFR